MKFLLLEAQQNENQTIFKTVNTKKLDNTSRVKMIYISISFYQRSLCQSYKKKFLSYH